MKEKLVFCWIDNVNINFGSSLHTPNFTYIAWGFPETTADEWWKYKTLVSSAKLNRPSDAYWQGLLTGDGLIDSTTYDACAWRTSVQDNVTMDSSDNYLQSLKPIEVITLFLDTLIAESKFLTFSPMNRSIKCGSRQKLW